MGLLVMGCEPDLGEAPFLCNNGTPLCPEGYECKSNYCVREGTCPAIVPECHTTKCGDGGCGAVDLGPDGGGDAAPDQKPSADKSRPLDGRGDTGRPTDGGGTTDATKPCPETYEPNETCPAAASLGSIDDNNGWSAHSSMASAATDTDWFTADGSETSHFCFPGTGQCYVFEVRVQPPAGRAFKVCLSRDVCWATPTCVDNLSQPGSLLDVKYQVSGTCGGDDNTTGKIQVMPVDGKSGCASYTIDFRYVDC